MKKRLLLNFKKIFKWSAFFTGSIYSVFGFIGTWAPTDEYILKDETWGFEYSPVYCF